MTRFGRQLARLAIVVLVAFAGGLLLFACTTATKQVTDATSTNDLVNVIDSNVEQDTADTGPDLSSEDANLSQDTSEGRLPFGSPCDTNKQCESNLCVPADVATAGTVYVCSKNCLEECPNDWQCKVIVLGADTLTVCLPKNASLCDIAKQCEWKDPQGNINEETQPCGNCGVRRRSCQPNCTYGDWGSCEGEGSCKFGTSEERSCGKCGTQVRVCTAECGWSSWSTCSGEKTCLPGQKQTQKCGNKCGMQERSCLSSCEWSDYGLCQSEGDCIPGTKQEELCTIVSPYFSSCRKRQRSCTQACSWGTYGICEKSGICEKGDQHPDSPRAPDPKDPDEVACWRKCGTMIRKCNETLCGWGPWECQDSINGECLRTGQTDPAKHNYKTEDCGSSCGKKTFWCAEFDGKNDKTQQPFEACTWTLRPEVDPDKACIESTESCSLTPTPEQETENCGLCLQGKRFRVCGEGTGTCAWGNWSTCSYELAPYKKECTQDGENNCYCQPGERETAACGKCGTKFRTCGNDCKWGTYSSCQSEGLCSPGEKDTQTGAKCLQEERLCTNSCKWGSWTTKYVGVCDQNTTDTDPCVFSCSSGPNCHNKKINCGTKTRSCNNLCQWGSYGSCVFPNNHFSGQTENCPLCGIRTWQASLCDWGVCTDEVTAIDDDDGNGNENNQKQFATTKYGPYSDRDDGTHTINPTLAPAWDVDYYKIHFSDDTGGVLDVKITLKDPVGGPKYIMNVEAFCTHSDKGKQVKNCQGVTSCSIDPECSFWQAGDDSIDVYIKVYTDTSPGGSCKPYTLSWTQ